MEEGSQIEDPRARRRRLLRASALALALLALGAGRVWWRHVSTIPPYTMPRAALPQPNAFDFLLCAADTLRTVPGSDAARNRAASADYVACVLEACAPALETFRAGMKHPFLTPLALDAVLHRFGYLQSFRTLGGTLAGQSRVAADIDDVEGALDGIAAVLRLGSSVPRGGILDHFREGCAIEHLGLAELAVLVPDLDAAHCRAAIRLLVRAERTRADLRSAIVRERDLDHELLSGLARRDPGAFRLLDRLLGWRRSGTPRVLYLWNLRGALAELERTTAEAARQYSLPAGRRSPFPATRHRLLQRDALDLARRLRYALRQADIRDARLRLLQVDLALRAHRLERGRAPAALADLVPAYLPAVPRDPYGAGEPLRYRPGREPLAYSVGPDRTDDGGRSLVRWRRLSSPYRPPEGDLATAPGQYDLWQPTETE